MSDLGVDRKEIKALCNNVVHSIANYAVILPYKSLEGSSNTLNAFATYSFPDYLSKQVPRKVGWTLSQLSSTSCWGKFHFSKYVLWYGFIIKGTWFKRYRCGFLREGLSRTALKRIILQKAAAIHESHRSRLLTTHWEAELSFLTLILRTCSNQRGIVWVRTETKLYGLVTLSSFFTFSSIRVGFTNFLNH